MEEQSFQEREGVIDSSISRLSEARPKFKPVLVKKLLAESDDDSDEATNNSDNSDEEIDDFDGFQPLSDEGNNKISSEIIAPKPDIKINVKDKGIPAATISTTAAEDNSESTIRNEESVQNPVLNSYLKDSLKISEYTSQKTEEKKLLIVNQYKPASAAKRKSSQEPVDQNIGSVQSQWQSSSGVHLDRPSVPVKEQNELNLKAKSYSPEVKRISHSTSLNHTNDVKDKVQHFESFKDIRDEKETKSYSSASVNKTHGEVKDEKIQMHSKIQAEQINSSKCITAVSNASDAVMDTPMKHHQGSSRPNPCHSHRNIFQTPQNKMSSDYLKNSLQTPATIFSHWSQQHMAQTPMQSQVPKSRESMPPTPATSITQSAQGTPRYFSETKSVRRPLAETMFSGPAHGSHLPKLSEAPNESQSSPAISRDNSNAIIQDNVVAEKKPVYSSSHVSHVPHETKENKNANNYESVDNKSNVEYHSKPYHSNMKPPPPRPVESYESHPKRESQSVHPPVTSQSIHPPVTSQSVHPPVTSQSVHPPVTSQSEPIQQIQCSIPQSKVSNTRQTKIITVNKCQYAVLGVLGQGMSCEVVRAQDLNNSELRAIKCVNLNKMDKDSAEGCLQEICMLDKLKAPCIVHMYSFEIKQPWVHVVMEIGDTDLSRLLKSMFQEKKKIPLTMILYYWTEMLTAVKHIHDHGVIHSDLKPANFLLVRGRLKLIDFGIASNINADMTSVVKNCPIGTLNYISPEALMDVNAGNTDSPNHNVKYKISYKSDVWSLGCILYSLVYGVTPFSHIRQQWAKLSAITDPKHKINFPVNTTEPVPLILLDVMRKCLQRDPKARPTVADLLQIPYLQNNVAPSVVPSIPSKILKKIKHSLDDEEWQQFIEILENKRQSK